MTRNASRNPITTYAIRYELNNTNYFNSAPEGEFNTYTLIQN